jgi:two-component system CheB/CheR fusion protein
MRSVFTCRPQAFKPRARGRPDRSAPEEDRIDRLPTIVAIGASAGGLEALEAFVHAIPNDSGLAYVVVQHLAPDQPSLLDKLLSAHTPLPVSRIEDGAEIVPDRVHVIPPGPFLEIADERFRLVEHAREAGARTPIDRLFASLAEAGGRRAFAVVLSGTGSDGTMGVRAIKANGGIALVQESDSARFPGMPDSAAATGLVDFILRPQDMPGRILEIVAHRRQIEEGGGRESMLETVAARLGEVLDRLQDTAGQSFAGYKPGTLVRRVARRMTLLRQSTLDGYLRTLDETPEERQLLTQDFLIGVTKFFRDPEAFDTLRDEALTPLFESDSTSFRIWVPGCSTGEEAYSIAILVAEMAEARGDTRSWKIFGTDIDLGALKHARKGRYADTVIDGLSDARRRQHFTRDEDTWQIASALREMCVFAPHNLISDPPFSKLDLVSCRNVMIYLNADSQAEVIPRFHYALNPGGFLWLGPSESLGRSERFFRTVRRGAKLFRRDDTASTAYSSLTAERRRGTPPPAAVPGPRDRKPNGRQPAQDIESLTERMYLQRRAAPFATVNRQNEVLYVSEAMTALVRPAQGPTSTALDDYLASELRLPIHSALDEARETQADAEVRNVVVEVDGAPRLYDVGVSPFGQDSDLMLVSLTEVRQRDLDAVVKGGGRRNEAQEQELLLTRKRLTTLEREYESSEQDLRGANEELLSMNEELQSSNEELQTSREELQSINEELETINAELTENNRQLTRAYSDLKNLLESTDIATLFIDDADCVRLYTPELGRLFGVQDRDIGRPIHDLASKVDYPDLGADAARVRRTLRPVERELRIEATDETFQARLRPYRTVDDRLDGVVITFVDITARKRNERQLEENARVLGQQYAELETLYDTAPIGLNLLDRDLRYLRINERLAEINGLPVEAHIGKRQEDLLPDAHAAVVEVQRQVFRTGKPAYGLEIRAETPAEPGRIREFLVDYYPVFGGTEVVAIGSCVREVTAEREMQRRIAESEARLSFALENHHLGAWDVDLATGQVETTALHNRIFGFEEPVDAWEAERTTDFVLEEDQPAVRAAYEEAIATGGHLVLNYRIRRLDGAIRWVEIQGRPVMDADGRPVRFAGTIEDVTERLEAERRKDILLAELEHRVKNILATVQAVARFTGRIARDKDEMVEGLVGRLAAISRTHDALTEGGWRARRLGELLQAEVSPYVDPAAERFDYRGDDVWLDPAMALSLGLAIHELTTNALKYGALSADRGKIEVTVTGVDGKLRRFDWVEVGGPRVRAPEREGFGMFLIEKVLATELNATIDVRYMAGGLRCSITLEAQERSEGAP